MEKSDSGFTLIELLVTLAIAGVLLSAAAPSFQTLVMNSRMSAQVDGLVTGLNYARNAALSGNVNTTVCPVGATRSTTCGSDWGAGWMIVSDPAGAPSLLHSFTSSTGRPVLAPVSTATGGAVSLAGVTFDPRGLASTQASFRLCDSRGSAFARSVYTLATGFVQTGPTPGLAIWGGALVCS